MGWLAGQDLEMGQTRRHRLESFHYVPVAVIQEALGEVSDRSSGALAVSSALWAKAMLLNAVAAIATADAVKSFFNIKLNSSLRTLP